MLTCKEGRRRFLPLMMTEQEAGWTFEQNKRFEQALAMCLEEDGDGAQEQEAGRWKQIATMVPGKSQAEVRRHYALLLQDVAAIEAGKVALPHYHHYSTSSPTRSWEEKMNKSMGLYGKASKASEQERKKGIPWTEEEHRLFLLGLDKFGKGDWRSISRNYVVSRTPTQVASHAQKYFIRLNSINKDKRRSSIHDITNASSPPPPPPPPPAIYPPPRPPPPPPPSFSKPPLHLPPLALIPPSHVPYAMHHQ